MAAVALTLLLDRLAGPDRPARHFKVGVRLMERDSIRRATNHDHNPIDGSQ